MDKRLRVSLAVGGSQATDEIPSASANVLTVVNDLGEIQYRYVDPRLDSAVTGNLEIQPGTIGTLALQYALSPLFLIEASVGYTRSIVGRIEIQEIQTQEFPIPMTYNSVFRLPAGDLTRVPLQLTGLVRFRPEARLNPYIGGGFGYQIVGFDPSEELDRLSLNLDFSRGRQARINTDQLGTVVLVPPGEPLRDLGPATVEAEDAWEWHVAGGAELSFGRRWAAFFDLRYTVASRDFHLQFDDRDELGISVPQGRTTVDSELAQATYGPLYVSPGGLLDLDGDGTADPGFYWVTGGKLRYDGFTAQLGVRYTF